MLPLLKKENNYFTDCVKNFNVGLHSDVLESICFKVSMMIILLDIIIVFDTGRIDFDVY